MGVRVSLGPLEFAPVAQRRVHPFDKREIVFQLHTGARMNEEEQEKIVRCENCSDQVPRNVYETHWTEGSQRLMLRLF